MKRINSKKDLPKSFNLNKYDGLEKMSDKDLFRQLYWRSEDLECINANFPEYGLEFGCEYPMNCNLGDPFDEIENPHDTDTGPEPRPTKPKLLSLSYSGGIRAITRLDISIINQFKADSGYWKGRNIVVTDDDVDDLFTKDNEMFWTVMSEPVSLLNNTLDSLYISVDLNTPDELLLEDFSSLLSKWRTELKIGESPKVISGGWDMIRRKILDYKIIPMIDLMSWANFTGSKITYEIFAVALFPDGEKGAFAIAQTIKPFIEKLLESDSLEKITRILSKE